MPLMDLVCRTSYKQSNFAMLPALDVSCTQVDDSSHTCKSPPDGVSSWASGVTSISAPTVAALSSPFQDPLATPKSFPLCRIPSLQRATPVPAPVPNTEPTEQSIESARVLRNSYRGVNVLRTSLKSTASTTRCSAGTSGYSRAATSSPRASASTSTSPSTSKQQRNPGSSTRTSSLFSPRMPRSPVMKPQPLLPAPPPRTPPPVQRLLQQKGNLERLQSQSQDSALLERLTNSFQVKQSNQRHHSKQQHQLVAKQPHEFKRPERHQALLLASNSHSAGTPPARPFFDKGVDVTTPREGKAGDGAARVPNSYGASSTPGARTSGTSPTSVLMRGVRLELQSRSSGGGSGPTPPATPLQSASSISSLSPRSSFTSISMTSNTSSTSAASTALPLLSNRSGRKFMNCCSRSVTSSGVCSKSLSARSKAGMVENSGNRYRGMLCGDGICSSGGSSCGRSPMLRTSTRFFSSVGGGAGATVEGRGGSHAAVGVSFLLLARATQMNAVVLTPPKSPYLTSVPRSMVLPKAASPLLGKRQGKPNMPRIAGL